MSIKIYKKRSHIKHCLQDIYQHPKALFTSIIFKIFLKNDIFFSFAEYEYKGISDCFDLYCCFTL